MKYFVAILSIVLLLPFGCAKRQEVSQEPPSENEITFEEITEDTTELSKITFEEEPKEKPEETPGVKTTEVTKIHGFRVQIGAYKNETAAKQEAESARIALSEDVYIEYIIPYYKLRVGNFLAKSDAVSYIRQVINKGYKGAFIVETTIIVE